MKSGYKQTEVGVIPEDWDAGGLGRFWSITDCKHVTAQFVRDGFPLASIREVQSRFVDLQNAKQTTAHFYNQLIEGGRKPRPGDSRLLPLPQGSRLVVDASDRAVASGQTCPADLSQFVKRDVKIYSVPNLHAKVFVLGRAAYVGSANVSTRSASQLVEAVVRTTDTAVVSDARQFVHDHCLHELTPARLKRLDKLYRPPLIPGGKQGKKTPTQTFRHPTLPRLLLAQMQLEDWSKRDQALHDAALVVAKKRQLHPRGFELDSFRLRGKCTYRRDDVVIQITDEGGDNVWVTPPGNVLHVRTRRDGRRLVSFIYLERPARRRRQIKVLAQTLGRGALKQLQRDGMVRDAAFARALLNTWAG